MSTVAIYVNDQKVFASLDDAESDFARGMLTVHEDAGGAIVFAYAMKPGQYAKVQIADGVETVKINE